MYIVLRITKPGHASCPSVPCLPANRMQRLYFSALPIPLLHSAASHQVFHHATYVLTCLVVHHPARASYVVSNNYEDKLDKMEEVETDYIVMLNNYNEFVPMSLSSTAGQPKQH